MATWVYPPIAPNLLKSKQEESLARELQWLLESLQDSLASLKEGLEECVALLAPKEPGSTLVLSSLRSESVKGFVTRIGTKIVKGDIHLRLSTLPPNTPRSHSSSSPSTHLILTPSPNTPDLQLPQLVTLKTLINACLDIIDVSRYTGQPTSAPFISGQFRLLHERLGEAKACLKGAVPGHPEYGLDVLGGEWWESSVSPIVFEPPLPANLSLHFNIQDNSLVLSVRTLAFTSHDHTPSTPTTDSSFHLSGFGLRERLFGIGHKLPTHDEVGQTFQWQEGNQEVSVKEKVRVESADPSLMSVAAKLSALEHEVGRCRANVAVVMGDVREDENT